MRPAVGDQEAEQALFASRLPPCPPRPMRKATREMLYLASKPGKFLREVPLHGFQYVVAVLVEEPLQRAPPGIGNHALLGTAKPVPQE